MAVPVVTCSADIVLSYDASGRTIQLNASATNSPTSWQWTILHVPPGSTANVGTKGDFVDGVSAEQNPQLEIDGGIDGGYCIQAMALNGDGSSSSLNSGSQQLIIVKTQDGEYSLPPDYAYDWGERYLNETIRAIEADLELAGETPLTTKGDILGYDTANARIPIGSDYGVLTSDSGQSLGVKYSRVVNASLDDMAQETIKGRASGAGTGAPTDLTPTQVTAMLNEVTSSLKGLAPASGGGTDNFLRADLSWEEPTLPVTTKGDLLGYDTTKNRVPVGSDDEVLTADSGQGLGVKYSRVANASLGDMLESTIKGRADGAGTGAPTDLTPAQATAIINELSDSEKGLAPASGGGTDNFLRADKSWAVPPGTGINPLTTKGDLYGYDTEATRIPVGVNERVLTADDTASLGVIWQEPQKSHEQIIDSSSSGNIDTQIDYLVYGDGNLDTPSGYDLMVFRDGVKMTYSATPSASNEYWFNDSLNEVRVIGDGSSHRWEVYYRSTAVSGYSANNPGTFGTANFGTSTFDG